MSKVNIAQLSDAHQQHQISTSLTSTSTRSTLPSLLMHIIAHKKDKQKLNVALTDHNQPPTQRLPELLYFLTKSIRTAAWILNFHIYGGDMPPLGKKFRQYTKFLKDKLYYKVVFFFTDIDIIYSSTSRKNFYSK